MFLAKAYRKTRKSSNFKKAVTAIAKKATMRVAETKTTNINVLGSVGLNGTIDSVWSKIAPGDGQFQRDGDRIRALGVKLRGYLSIDPAVITSSQDHVVVRMVVFSGKRPITTVTDSALTYNGSVDPELLNILVDKFITFKIDGRTRTINKYIKFNRLVQYGANVNVPTKNELYIGFLPYQTFGTGLTTTTGVYLNYTMQPYYKDI